MTTETVTPATVMREYFKTGNKVRQVLQDLQPRRLRKRRCVLGCGRCVRSRCIRRHRQVLSWPEEVRQHKARTALKKARLQGRAA